MNRRTTAADLVRGLSANGYPTRALAGNVPQDRRLKMLEEFKDGRLAVLVATDVASRGLHIDGVSHVINYDLPEDSEDYVHRIGRTGRAGALGTAVSFACDDYVFSLDAIEKRIGRKIPVEWPPESLFRSGRVAQAPARPRRLPLPPRLPPRSGPQAEAAVRRGLRPHQAQEPSSLASRWPAFRPTLPQARGANSLPTEGREEVRAAGANAKRAGQASGRARRRAARRCARRAQTPSEA